MREAARHGRQLAAPRVLQGVSPAALPALGAADTRAAAFETGQQASPAPV